MARYDIPMPMVAGVTPEYYPTNYPIQTASGALYYVQIDPSGDVVYYKSTDRGLSWGSPVSVNSAANLCLATWYDRWSSSSGDVIHIAYTDGTSDDVLYRPLDTATDTLGTETVVFAGASAVAAQCILSIVKSRGGNLYCAFNMDSGTEEGFYRSTDSGATWGVRANVGEAVLDYFILVPGFAADTNDIMCIYWDRSADEISRKNYDDSGDSWGETSIAGTMADSAASTDSPQFSCITDLANSRALLAAWSARDTANADLRFWTITDAAITESATNVVLNSTDDQGMVAVGLATDTSTVYVFYVGKSDGSETMASAVNVYYKTSTDVGATWSAETKFNTTVRAGYVWHLQCAPRFIGNPVVVRHTSLVTSGAPSSGVAVFSPDLSATNTSVEIAVGNDKATGTTLSTTTTVSAAVGDLIVGTLVTDNESATDGETTLHTDVTVSGQGMTKAKEFTNSQGASNAGVTTSVWYLLVQSAIIDGVAVAGTLNSGKDAKAIELRVFSWPSGYTVEVDGTNTLATDGADPGSLTATGSRDLQHLWWRGIGSEESNTTVGALTPTSGWTATTGTGTTGGAAASNASVCSEWKFATGTGSGASDPTLVSADHASVLVGFVAVPPAGLGSAHVIGG